MPGSKPGVRVEIVSLEPIVLLGVTSKIADAAEIEVRRSFYIPVWHDARDLSHATNRTRVSASARLAAIQPSDVMQQRGESDLARPFGSIVHPDEMDLDDRSDPTKTESHRDSLWQ